MRLPTALLLALLLALAPALSGAAPDPLADKAERFRAALVERHLAPEGVVLYRMRLSTWERDLRGGNYPELADTPTFTGLLAATSCLRASLVSGPERREALSDAQRALEGLELLTRVTGIPGLLARGIRRTGPEPVAGERGRWYPGAPGYEAYRWRGDVSMDQYANGLLPALWECRTAFPERTARLAGQVAGMLLARDMHLVDPDGRTTRYGDLSWRANLGLNSIAQLTGYAALAVAAHLDPDGPWRAAVDRARDRQRVPARSRITNVRLAGITGHSNDMMAWNLYRVLVPLARETRDPALGDLRHGMHRTWLRVRRDGNAYFALVLCRVEAQSCDPAAVAQARDLLARFPLDKRRIAADDALDRLPARLLPGRGWKRLARDPVPIELRKPSSFEWKSSPYRLARGRSPDIEYTGLDYLAAYWLLRAHDAADAAGAR